VTAVTDLVCYGLTFWEFRPLIERNGAIAWKLLQALAKRLRAAGPGQPNQAPTAPAAT
jgi:CRP-like cAMP-binding protein